MGSGLRSTLPTIRSEKQRFGIWQDLRAVIGQEAYPASVDLRGCSGRAVLSRLAVSATFDPCRYRRRLFVMTEKTELARFSDFKRGAA